MRKTLLGTFVGLLAGSFLGGLLAFLVHLADRPPDPERSWVSYPTLASSALPGGDRVVHDYYVRTPPAWLLFSGALFGGGFGALAGSIVGAVGAITRVLADRPQRSATGGQGGVQ